MYGGQGQVRFIRKGLIVLEMNFRRPHAKPRVSSELIETEDAVIWHGIGANPREPLEGHGFGELLVNW